MTKQPSLRERKKANTRRALARAGLDLFLSRGYDATSIDDITEAAGVSRRTFFRYFERKEDVVFGAHAELIALFQGLLQERLSGESAFAAIRRAALVVASEFEAQRGELIEVLHLVWSTPALSGYERRLDAEWEDAMAAAVARDAGTDPASDLRAQLIAGAAMGAINAGVRVWVSDSPTLTAPEAVARAFDLLESGLGE